MTTKKGTGSYFRATTWPRSEYSNRQNKVTPHYVKNKYKFKVSSFVPSADMLNLIQTGGQNKFALEHFVKFEN